MFTTSVCRPTRTTMHLLHTLYPVALSGANVALGVLLYHLSESIAGGVLVAIGVFVVFAWLGGMITEHQLLRRTTSGEA